MDELQSSNNATIEENDVFSGETIDFDLSAEAVAQDAELLENIAFDNGISKKRPIHEGSGDISGSNRARKKKKSNNNPKGSKKKGSKFDATKLNDLTTIEDLSTIDASAYLAWVNSQAGNLPSVFVAEKQSDDGEIDSTPDNDKANFSSDSRREDPIDGSAATLQILLSKQMEILPPPSTRHVPPACDAAEFHISSTSSIQNTDNNITNKEEDDDNNNDIISCSNWVSTTISSFSKLRSYLETQDAILKQNDVDTQTIRKVAVPKMKDRTGWHVFCLGREEAFGNQGGYFENIINSEDEEDNEGDKVDTDTNVVNDEAESNTEKMKEDPNILSYNQSDVPPNGYIPTSSLLLQIDQVLTRVLFHHHVHYFCDWKFPLTHQRAAWIYALLARMGKPWHRDECCVVRKVLRECCSRRWELSLPKDDDSSSQKTDKKWEQLALLNTLIAITGIYYEQGSKAGGDGMDLLFKPKSTL